MLLGTASSGQDLPGKIRGYKLYKTDIRVLAPADRGTGKSRGSASVGLGEIRTLELGLFSATVEVGAEISSIDHSGKVDFLMFRDFTVNGISVDIEEYDHPFVFSRNKPLLLAEPIRISLSFADLPKAVYREVVQSPVELPVRGTVLVFGRFRKMGFEFKRVIPISVDIKIRNPLRD